MSVKGSWSRVQNKPAFDKTLDSIVWNHKKPKDMPLSEVVQKLTSQGPIKGPGYKPKENNARPT